MDPAVTAALIATPTAALAAGAAYAAGRAQGSGTVSAVRRQNQRDAYADFITAVQRFTVTVEPAANPIATQYASDAPDAHRNPRYSGGPRAVQMVTDDQLKARVEGWSDDRRRQVAAERYEAAREAFGAVRAAGVRVFLEGPPHLRDLAIVARNHMANLTVALHAQADGLAVTSSTPQDAGPIVILDAHEEATKSFRLMGEVMSDLFVALSDYLNGHERRWLPPWRRSTPVAPRAENPSPLGTMHLTGRPNGHGHSPA